MFDRHAINKCFPVVIESYNLCNNIWGWIDEMYMKRLGQLKSNILILVVVWVLVDTTFHYSIIVSWNNSAINKINDTCKAVDVQTKFTVNKQTKKNKLVTLINKGFWPDNLEYPHIVLGMLCHEMLAFIQRPGDFENGINNYWARVKPGSFPGH